MKSRIGEGYLLIDHRASPGLPADMARAAGFEPREMAEGAMLEKATMTCSHCGSVVVLNTARTRERAYCGKCDHYICDGCQFLSTRPDYQHQPLTQQIDRVLDGVADNPLPLVLALSS